MAGVSIDVKTFFIFPTFFTFLKFFYFPKVFYYKKRWQIRNTECSENEAFCSLAVELVDIAYSQVLQVYFYL